jgi:predicted heme/steroid binding protein
MMRKLLWIVLVLLTLTLSACKNESNKEFIELTLEELSYYDGKEGRPAYIAVNGNIYDVSDSFYWTSGMHNGYAAGQDLTETIINESPHGLANLNRVPMIGKIIEGD